LFALKAGRECDGNQHQCWGKQEREYRGCYEGPPTGGREIENKEKTTKKLEEER